MNNSDQINENDWVILENTNFENQGFKKGTVCSVFLETENTDFMIVNNAGDDICVKRSDIRKVTNMKIQRTAYTPSIQPSTDDKEGLSDTANVEEGPAIYKKLKQQQEQSKK